VLYITSSSRCEKWEYEGPRIALRKSRRGSIDEDLSTDVITEVPPGEKRPLGADRPEYGSEGKLFKGGTVVPVRIRVRVSGEVKVDGNRTIKVLPPPPESGSLLYELH